jgi:tripartite-type tricarboxylate transporter receptor subunit TctC
MPASTATDVALQAKPSYDIGRDFAPVSLAAIGPYILIVHPSVPARNVSELVALARAQPGKLNYASSGVGGTMHLAAEVFNIMAKVKTVNVPYKGGVECVVATAGGHVDLSFPTLMTALPPVNNGKLRALGVTSIKRASLTPSIPTLDEAGLKGYDRPGWFGIVGPAGLPKEIVTRLNTVMVKAINTSETKDSLVKQGFEPQTTTPEQFAALIRNEVDQTSRLIKLLGIKPN